MARLLMLSIIAATLALPIWASGHAHPGRALRQALAGLCAFIVLYWLLVLFVTPRPG